MTIIPFIYVGTSGWMYDWNLGGNLDWYVLESGLNAVELNSSFYRTPARSRVERWAGVGRSLRWSVKVNRIVTHYAKLSDKALVYWKTFREVFHPMDHLIDFFLLQMPPSFSHTESNVRRLKSFLEKAPDDRFAVEFRDPSWYSLDVDSLCGLVEKGVIVSVDSPSARKYLACNGVVYLRMHGRTDWYLYEYSLNELRQVAESILRLRPSKIYVFFNNDHWMLENARLMLSLLRGFSP